MKTNIITCDICDGEMFDKKGSGYSIHIKGQRIWWYLRRKESINDIDVCRRCYQFIQRMVDADGCPLRTVYEIYHRMVPADMEILAEEGKYTDNEIFNPYWRQFTEQLKSEK